MSPSVGVVVPCKNEVATLRLCLDSLRAQQPKIDYIIVMDNGSTDGSRDIALSLADRVIDLPGAAISTLRNAGAAALRNVDVIGFVDADCELDHGWLGAGLRGLQKADLVGSRSLAPPDGTWVAARWAEIERRRAHAKSLLWSQHLLITRATFEQLGGFDETMPTGEDSDLSSRVRANGGRLAMVDDMIAIHHGFPATLRRFIRREVWHTSTPGWYGRMAPKSKTLVLLAAGWMAAGVAAAAASGAQRQAGPVLGWATVGCTALSALGCTIGSARHSVQDGTLLGIWSLIRAGRLWHEALSGKTGLAR